MSRPQLLDESAFIYMEPRAGSYGKQEWFAQCATCVLWVWSTKRCMIHGTGVRATADTTCALYINGKPRQSGTPEQLVTPKESGAVKRLVQCHRCFYYKKVGRICMLFEYFNKVMKGLAKLRVKVHPHGCCNAQVPEVRRT